MEEISNNSIDFLAGMKVGLKGDIDDIDDIESMAKLYKIVEEIKETGRKKSGNNTKPFFEVLSDPQKLIEKYSNYLISDDKRENTVYDYCYEARKFMNFLVKEEINFIDLDVVREYLAYRKKAGKLGKNGFRKLFFSLKSFLKYLMKMGLVNFDLEEIEPPQGVNNKQEIVTDTDF